MDRTLALTILLNGVDRLSGPLRNIVGLGRSGGQELGRMRREARDLDRELSGVRSEMAGASGNITQLINRERELTDAIEGANRAMDRQRQVMQIDGQVARMNQQAEGYRAAGRENIVQGGAILAPFVLAARGAMDFSSGMVDLQQKTNLTNAELITMRGNILAASRATHQLPEDMRAAVDVLASAGMDPRQAVLLAQPIGRLGTAFKVDLADAAAAAYSNLNNLRVPLADTAEAFDIMAAGGNAGAFEIRNMARWFPTLTARMQALGQTGLPAVADLTAALQVAMNTAGSADEAANNIANLMAKINSPATIRAFHKNFGVDLPAALRRLEAQGMTTMEAFATIADQATGGDDRKLSFLVEDQQAQLGLLALIQNMEEYRQIRGDIANSSGTIDAAFSQREMNDGMIAWQAFKVQMTSTALVLGTKLLPAASQFLTIVGGMASAVGDFAEANPQLTTGLLYLVAGTGAAKLGLGALQLAFGGILGPMATVWGHYRKWRTAGSIAEALPRVAGAFGQVRTAALALGGGLRTAGAMALASPLIGAVALAAVGIGAAAYLIWRHWDTIKAAFLAAVDWASSVWQRLKALFLTAPGLFGPLGAAAGLVINHWDTIKAAFDTSHKALGKVWNWVKANISKALVYFGPLGAAASVVVQHWDTIKGAFSGAADWISQALALLATGRGLVAIYQLGRAALVAGVRFVTAGVRYAVMAAKFVAGKAAAAATAVRALGFAALTAGRRFVTAGAGYTVMAAKFVAGKAMAAAGVLRTVGVAALTMGKSFLRAGLMMLANPVVLIVAGIALAAYLIYTHWDTIKAAFSTAMTWIGQKWDEFKGWLSSGWAIISALFSSAGGWISTAWTNIKTAFQTGVGMIGQAWQWIKDKFNTGLAYIQELPGRMLALGGQIIQGLVNGLSPTALANRLLSIARSGITAFKNFFGIQSPSRLFLQMGGHLTAGLERGIDRGARGPTRAVGALSRQVTAAWAAAVATPALALAAPIADPAIPAIPALQRMTLPVDLDIARNLQLPAAIMRVAPQLDPLARLASLPGLAGNAGDAQTRREVLQPRGQLAPSGRSGRDRNDRQSSRSDEPGSGLTINMTIQQQPGEDSEQLARRVVDLIDRRRASSRLGAYRDE